MTGSCMHRPSFAACWSAAQRIYEPSNPSDKVARVVGGAVAWNILKAAHSQRWRNTCAVRMSYILNHSGLLIPVIPKSTVPGADHRQYFFRISALKAFLQQRWGLADQCLYDPVSGYGFRLSKGILIFDVSGWGDASGHATLFDGRRCYDQCYFNDGGQRRYHVDCASLWNLE